MVNKFVVTIIALIAVLGMVLPGCGAPTEPEPEVRTTGPFFDEVVITREPTPSAAILKLSKDEIDIYPFGLADASLYQRVLDDPEVRSEDSYGSYNEFTFNPVGPIFPGTGKLNPFAVPAFREAMNWLIDRNYIAGNIMGGLAVPRVTCFNGIIGDGKERYGDLIAAMNTKYAHNPTKAASVIKTEMEKLGAVLEGGKWKYGGEDVEIIFAIRVEDERKAMGDYFAGLLEGQGFKVTRRYGTSGELSPVWLGDPARGVMHVYTGGWVSTVIPRNEVGNFGSFYTKLWAAMGPLWQAYVNDPVFYAAAEKLWNNDFKTMAERKALVETCLPLSLQDSVRIWLVTRKSFTAMRNNVRVANDLAGGVLGSWMWALTAHFADAAGKPVVGGTYRVALSDTMTEPWNPIAGTNWAFDMFPIRATGDMGHHPDTRTGLRWPGRITRAEVVVKEGLPVGVTLDWCKLSFAPEIQVPPDAWADWNAVTQKFITVRERFGLGGTTALRKSVSYYPKDIFTIPLHDGSTLSMGDFIMGTILTFDRAKPESPLYDEGYVAEFTSFMRMFKGVKFITDNPDWGLIVEYYTDSWELDAERMVTTMFPVYSQGPGMWHTIGLGILAETDKALAFSKSKATKLGVEWMSFIAGPSIAILKSKLDTAKGGNYIPYKPTMGEYVTTAEATSRWTNLSNWYDAKKHFWVASGPFYLEKAFTVEKVLHLKRFEAYPDKMDRWLFLLQPVS